ncbi:MAG: hypothetical protein PHU43_02940 [Candidatus Bipolaricaulis sp.]|nr:hypothetical protein [Candidatus Bipolaricaulis sp.]
MTPPHMTEANLRQMYGLLMEARSRTNDWRYWHIGELAFGFFMIDCRLDSASHARRWHAGRGSSATRSALTTRSSIGRSSLVASGARWHPEGVMAEP